MVIRCGSHHAHAGLHWTNRVLQLGLVIGQNDSLDTVLLLADRSVKLPVVLPLACRRAWCSKSRTETICKASQNRPHFEKSSADCSGFQKTFGRDLPVPYLVLSCTTTQRTFNSGASSKPNELIQHRRIRRRPKRTSSDGACVIAEQGAGGSIHFQKQVTSYSCEFSRTQAIQIVKQLSTPAVM